MNTQSTQDHSAAGASDVVQRQLDAYNARDLEALLQVYAADAQLFEHPATLLAQGSDAIRQRFQLRFQETNLHARLLQRIVMGSMVVDYEEVTRTFPEGPGTLELTMIYEVRGDRISRAWTLVGPKRMAAAS